MPLHLRNQSTKTEKEKKLTASHQRETALFPHRHSGRSAAACSLPRRRLQPPPASTLPSPPSTSRGHPPPVKRPAPLRSHLLLRSAAADWNLAARWRPRSTGYLKFQTLLSSLTWDVNICASFNLILLISNRSRIYDALLVHYVIVLGINFMIILQICACTLHIWFISFDICYGLLV
jgi:hypothetical protein